MYCFFGLWDATFALRMEYFKLSQEKIGLIMVLWPALLALSAPFVEKCILGKSKRNIITGALCLNSLSILFMGPS